MSILTPVPSRAIEAPSNTSCCPPLSRLSIDPLLGAFQVILLLQSETDKDTIVVRSVDAGATWTVGAPLTVQLTPPLSGIKPTCGHGIAIQQDLCTGSGGCAHAGRLVVCFQRHVHPMVPSLMFTHFMVLIEVEPASIDPEEGSSWVASCCHADRV
jgi:hypothetical protein